MESAPRECAPLQPSINTEDEAVAFLRPFFNKVAANPQVFDLARGLLAQKDALPNYEVAAAVNDVKKRLQFCAERLNIPASSLLGKVVDIEMAKAQQNSSSQNSAQRSETSTHDDDIQVVSVSDPSFLAQNLVKSQASKEKLEEHFKATFATLKAIHEANDTERPSRGVYVTACLKWEHQTFKVPIKDMTKSNCYVMKSLQKPAQLGPDYEEKVTKLAKRMVRDRNEREIVQQGGFSEYSVLCGVCPLHLMLKLIQFFEQGATKIREKMKAEKNSKRLKESFQALISQDTSSDMIENNTCIVCKRVFLSKEAFREHEDDVCIDIPDDF